MFREQFGFSVFWGCPARVVARSECLPMVVSATERGDPPYNQSTLPHQAVVWADDRKLVLCLRSRKNRLAICLDVSVCTRVCMLIGASVTMGQQTGEILLV